MGAAAGAAGHISDLGRSRPPVVAAAVGGEREAKFQVTGKHILHSFIQCLITSQITDHTDQGQWLQLLKTLVPLNV